MGWFISTLQEKQENFSKPNSVAVISSNLAHAAVSLLYASDIFERMLIVRFALVSIATSELL